MTSSDVEPATTRTRARASARTISAKAGDFSAWFFVKLLLIALVDALGVFIIWQAWTVDSWWVLGGTLVALLVVNWVYFSHRTVPAKYLVPGLLFLMIYQVFTIVYTGYVSITNYGDGHNSTKESAIAQLLAQNERTLPDATRYPVAVVEDEDGDLGLAILDVETDSVSVGWDEEPLEAAPDAVVEDGRIVSVPDVTVLQQRDVYARASDVAALRVPFSDDAADGSLRTTDGRTAAQATSRLVYDEDADTMTNVETGVVYSPNGEGSFVSDDGEALNVGWRVVVGADNYVDAFSDARYAGPLLKVLLWTIVFAFLSVATTFLLGLFLAVVFNDPRVKGQKIYRTLLILPYAFPGFLAALLWAGLLNERFGFINNVLLFGADIPWLTDPWLAKLSVLGVNLWLGFPYMFLICTSALQAIPGDLKEAARIDGASTWQQFRSLTFPLVMVATAPLLISSFAFNFNNFNLIYMLTGGGPRMSDATVPVGHTDILISMVYKIAGIDGGAQKDYGLASALSIMIFVIIAVISIIGFRQARKLEEYN
ncbi:Maltose/maltodextrin ABC transporter, permease protein MalF [Actinomycetales bacterium JB111]|nr:Maltose/maltodextrin ABC transporter, permease protein MalF [Actinomycetales bacterium JB111]